MGLGGVRRRSNKGRNVRVGRVGGCTVVQWLAVSIWRSSGADTAYRNGGGGGSCYGRIGLRKWIRQGWAGE